VSLTPTLSFGSALLLWATLAAGQSSVGELLDAGARRLSAEEFQRELVGRTVAGPISDVSEVELVYMVNGRVLGSGQGRGTRLIMGPVEGSWTVGETGSICSTMTVGMVVMPKRCQFWFKLGDAYFISDSDSDRSARVLRRTVK
jgi:hypothetical protein